MSIAAVAQATASDDQSTAKRFQALLQIGCGYWVSQCLYVAASLDIAAKLANGPASIEALAQQCNANEDALYRVLRALAGRSIFKEEANRHFSQTPLSELLRDDVEYSIRSVILMMMSEEHYQAWAHLLPSVKSGTRPFEAVFGMPVFEYFAQHPQASQLFNQAMTSFATNLHRTVLSVYDFSRFHTLVDVGGGQGSLLMGILGHTPTLKGVLFDLPHVVQNLQVPEALKSRFQAVGGDFFQSVHAGGDAYIASMVIHDWSDALALKILRSIHTAMADNGTLLLVENVVEADNKPSPGKFMDINMLVMTEGGRERSEAEFRKLYADAGFELTRVLPLPSGLYIVEGVKR